MMASLNGHEAVVGLLLARNDITVNTQAKNGRTALILASIHGHEAVVRLFLSRGDVDLNLQDEYGDTALITASLNGHEAPKDSQESKRVKGNE